MEEEILTLHPEGKKGVNINKEKYDKVRDSIVECLRKKGDTTHTQLVNCVNKNLKGKFRGSASWYMETVKLDLEARCVIERDKKTKPTVYRLSTGNYCR